MLSWKESKSKRLEEGVDGNRPTHPEDDRSKENNVEGFIQLGCTAENMNYRNRKGDLDERLVVRVIAQNDSDKNYEYFFKCPGLWTNVMRDYLTLVQAAYPNHKIACEILADK